MRMIGPWHNSFLEAQATDRAQPCVSPLGDKLIQDLNAEQRSLLVAMWAGVWGMMGRVLLLGDCLTLPDGKEEEPCSRS